MTPEERREKARQRYLANRAVVLERSRQYAKANPEKLLARNRAYRAANREKVLAAKRAYAAKNKERIARVQREWQRRQNGLPSPSRPEPAHCECCGARPKIALNLDHDHKTGAFRGWLCWNCNTAIGKLGDDLEGIERARQYLIRADFQRLV